MNAENQNCNGAGPQMNAKVVKQLSLMFSVQHARGLEFHDNSLVNHEIRPKERDWLSSKTHRNWHLEFGTQSTICWSDGERPLVD